ncbi:hypothetical protein A3K78_02590 [Candidatus Bathyarchaeota archaeon RBG_13_52_12]|nr:MAG: hypothetical protein A3K78_02590 [Candidatus Bathyarchaeota archaeon RBG_13_52_12]
MAHYAPPKYVRCDPLDEFVMLSRQLIKISEGEKVEKAKEELEKALSLIKGGNRVEASKYAVKSYRILHFPP